MTHPWFDYSVKKKKEKKKGLGDIKVPGVRSLTGGGSCAVVPTHGVAGAAEGMNYSYSFSPGLFPRHLSLDITLTPASPH